jgi:succinate dehydrogenase / fumarate reductase cytochrome b subunit
MSEATAKSGASARPQFRNIAVSQLAAYRLPLAGILSILHRVSGALMFLIGLPFVLYLFDKSITSEISFEQYRAVAGHWFGKLVLLGLIWAYLHHFCAGIRYLVLDLHIGVDKEQAHLSSIIVFAVSLALTALVALKLFGAF